ncbi:docking domain of Afi1 for Arf3 in vesicle trafficking-domain-containing protein [Kockovaella imperatae]|uniref:Docking domain of Afi1 for Arf3 in vesicle trafficking-domain-containing protein n=1 Tax=Kockovaella imperatae TaxID=4999 RepID=A0A1Y1UPZ4_9TREE|nr:docking domain of Afi1 for Arf3 in vesicle trafficking-domain-containing protein [Kockovaella imperatae]ORX40101.1 docking domain of Afi1 for Arf3 in vesicle trafficking-domain-containing protein [Kockovaella imperatae]
MPSHPPETPGARSDFTVTSTERDPESELAHLPAEDLGEDQVEDAVHFCLLAEFDIDAGATLAHQYPYPTGTDEHRLAELMLPDGAHLRPEDWTIFYLGQTPSSAVAPMLAHEISSPSGRPLSATSSSIQASISESGPSDLKPKRGVAGGGLLYVLNCVRMKEDKSVRRGAMVKALAICTPNPYIGIYKPLLLLALEEYFISPSPEILARLYDAANAIPRSHMPRLSRNERILLRNTERRDLFEDKFVPEPTSGTREFFENESEGSTSSHRDQSQQAAVRSSLGSKRTSRPALPIRHGSASTSSLRPISTPTSGDGILMPDVVDSRRKGVPRDTHFFETEARFQKISVPIRIPMAVFEEDVGDYSVIELVQAFSHAHAFPPPFHPYLHTNGPQTHPIILILNALLANKRVVFLGYGHPANQVARMVLAACALVSGSGQVLRGVTANAFPYANLASLDVLEEFSGYVAGVCNPRFEDLPGTWDVLCNLETGKVTVSKNLQNGGAATANHLMGSMKSARSSDTSLTGSIVKVEDDPQAGTPAAKMKEHSRPDCVDNQFMEDIQSAMAAHFGEAHIRQRFIDYISRFVRLASYHEFIHTGQTRIGYRSITYSEGQLGSGTVFADEASKSREMRSNVHRIEAWKKTRSYKLCAKDWARHMKTRAIGFDVQHQIARLRLIKNMTDGEAEAIFSCLAAGIRSYEQVVELLTILPSHWGGLLPIANGLFHRWPGVREAAIEVLQNLQQYNIGRQAIGALNYFHRKAFLQLLERREMTSAQHQLDRAKYKRDASPISINVPVDLASPDTVQGDNLTPQEAAAMT